MEPSNKIKVGVLTLPYDPNYGWILQHYALMKSLNDCGFETYSVYRKWNMQKGRSFIYYLQKWLYYNISTRNINKFYNQYVFPKTELYNTQESIFAISKYRFDAIIVGSDQVWRTKKTALVGNNFFLDFIDSKNTRKIAYAASFGIDEWQEDEQITVKIKSLLEDFDYVSVRESSGIDICKRHFNVNAELVIDPTLLLEKTHYNILLNGKKLLKKPTLVTYILDYNEDKKKIISQISKKLNLSVYNLYPKKKKIWNYYKSVENWLKAFRDADYIVTDSFHGTVFSIIYNKPFVTIGNKERGLTRFQSILNLVGLSSRLIFCSEDLNKNENLLERIDFSDANHTIIGERKRSFSIFKRIERRN